MKIHPLFASFLLASCMHTLGDHAVNLQLSNGGSEILQCKIIYGHWVERDLGALSPGTTFDVALRQQEGDHALFVYRDDMQRRLMIENIVCGRQENWHETTGQIDLGPVRGQAAAYVEATCAAPIGPGRVSCQLTDLAAKE